MLQNYKVSSTPTQSLTLPSWLNTTNQHQRNQRPPPIATAVVGAHIWHSCYYEDQICHHHGKQGHIQRVCCSKQQGKPYQATNTPEIHAVEVDVDAYEDILATFEVHNVRKQRNDIIWVDLDVDGKPLKMELDTGSAVSIISCDLYQQKFLQASPAQNWSVLENLHQGKHYASGSAQSTCRLPKPKRIAGPECRQE